MYSSPATPTGTTRRRGSSTCTRAPGMARPMGVSPSAGVHSADVAQIVASLGP